MITNAAILRIDRVTGVTATGQPKITAGDAVSIRCGLDSITSRQRYGLGAAIADAELTCYVLASSLAHASESDPARGDRLTLHSDRDGATAFQAEVVAATDRLAHLAGRQSHLELFLRRLPLTPAVEGV